MLHFGWAQPNTHAGAQAAVASSVFRGGLLHLGWVHIHTGAQVGWLLQVPCSGGSASSWAGLQGGVFQHVWLLQAPCSAEGVCFILGGFTSTGGLLHLGWVHIHRLTGLSFYQLSNAGDATATPGINQAHGFAPLGQPKRTQLLREGAQLTLQERQARGLPGQALPQPILRARPALQGLPASSCSRQGRWLGALEACFCSWRAGWRGCSRASCWVCAGGV